MRLLPRRESRVAPALRSKQTLSCCERFFRFAELRGWCKPGLATAIMPPRVYKNESLPAGPTWEDVGRLLARTESERPADIRDRAILMLFAVYGLRVAEVRRFRLEDLDWHKETICITQSSNGGSKSIL